MFTGIITHYYRACINYIVWFYSVFKTSMISHDEFTQFSRFELLCLIKSPKNVCPMMHYSLNEGPVEFMNNINACLLK